MSNYTCCYNCPDRYVGCHSKCEKYKNKQKENIEEKKWIKQFNRFSKGAYDAMIKKHK